MHVKLLGVPLWIVERTCKMAESVNYQQCNEIEARREKRRRDWGRPPAHFRFRVSAFLLGYFARPLDCPERGC